ncbi:hypothetical protein Goshw_013900 [Gossypium schwendimanii]|uniref:Uncharacterized protein n=2 Tax=Gossypium schwendimanii TaxID=34291 RepID=A0A7J9LAK3_GOSSC|nr:hypothetical protein [Gossypium schwendimanii]
MIPKEIVVIPIVHEFYASLKHQIVRDGIRVHVTVIAVQEVDEPLFPSDICRGRRNTVDEPALRLKAIFNFRVPDQRSGTDISFDTKIGNFTKHNVGLSFNNPNLIASLALHVVMNEKGDLENASYYHIVNPSTNIGVGVEVTHSFSTNVNTITVGTQHALDPLTTIKARMNNTDKASALIQHEWHPKSLFTISREVDTKSIDNSPKVGLALALKP